MVLFISRNSMFKGYKGILRDLSKKKKREQKEKQNYVLLTKFRRSTFR